MLAVKLRSSSCLEWESGDLTWQRPLAICGRLWYESAPHGVAARGELVSGVRSKPSSRAIAGAFDVAWHCFGHRLCRFVAVRSSIFAVELFLLMVSASVLAAGRVRLRHPGWVSV